MDWASKAHRIRSSWYSRALDSNTTVVSLLNHNNSYPSYKLVSFFKDNLVSQNVRNLPNNFQNTSGLYLTTLKSNTANTASNSLPSGLNVKNVTPLCILPNIFYHNSFINFHKLPTYYTHNLLSELNSHMSLNNNTMINSALNFQVLSSLQCLNFKNAVEFYKSISSYYAPSSRSLSQLLNGGSKFQAALEPVRYTFELKARFGYNLYKLDLFTPISEEAKTGESLPLMLLKEYSEYDLKDMNTITRYFMVFDQNRRQALRIYKPAKTIFVNRGSKFEVFNQFVLHV